LAFDTTEGVKFILIILSFFSGWCFYKKTRFTQENDEELLFAINRLSIKDERFA
jgi:hypothetical protein